MKTKVSIVMGSVSDWPTMKETCKLLDKLKISCEKRVISAHRMPLELTEFAQNAHEYGIQVIIAGGQVELLIYQEC